MPSARFDHYLEILADHGGMEKLLIFPFITAENVLKDFDMGDYLIRATDHISITIEKGEFVVLIGASGAGKTTLLHLLSGLDRPSEGLVRLNYIDITPMEEETLATFRLFTAGMVFQNYNLISSLTALENVMFPAQICGVSMEEAEQKALKLLKDVGMEERVDHLPVQLSAGEQQRVALARALINDPPIIFADEPTANLDKKSSAFISKYFNELHRKGKTLVVATHDDALIEQADHIIELDDGKLISDKILKKNNNERQLSNDKHKEEELSKDKNKIQQSSHNKEMKNKIKKKE